MRSFYQTVWGGVCGLAVAVLAAVPAAAVWAQVGPSTALVQTQNKSPAPPAWHGPHLLSPEARQPIQIARVSVQTEIVGQAARSQIEVVFKNPNAQVLEGELLFPLADGQSITGFALDIGGEMRPAVPVEKAKGQQIFEDVVRQRVDPALLEKTQGNQYKLRVYPLPAQGERRVSIELIETLPLRQGQALYRLPLQWPQTLAKVDVRVRMPGVRAEALQPGRGLIGAQVRTADGGAELLWTQSDWQVRQPMDLNIQLGTAPTTASQTFDGQTFFYAELPLPADFTTAPLPLPRPQRLGLVWDASGSAALRDVPRELALLDGLMAAWSSKGEGDLLVDLVLARERPQAPQRFVVKQGNWRALREVLERVAYDGATAEGALVAVPGCDLNLLFSDGVTNFGPTVKTLSPQVPMHTVQSSAGADGAWLRQQAQASGGQWLDLSRTTPAQAVKLLTQSRGRIKAWRGEGVSSVVFASRQPDTGRVQFAGVLTEAATTVTLELETASGKPRTLSVPLRAQDHGALAASRWAAMTMEALEAERGEHKGDIVRLGKRFGLASSQTSLIVLDSVYDYVQHEIAPPASLRARYEVLLAQKWQQKQQSDRQHLDAVVRRFQNRITWYELNHLAPADREAEVTNRRQRDDRAELAPDDIRLPRAPLGSVAPTAPALPNSLPLQSMPLPAPPPAPVASAAAMASAGGAQVAPALAKPAAGAGTGTAARGSTLSLSTWQASDSFSRRMQAATVEQAYAMYLQERPSRRNSAAFFVDSAEVFFDKGADDLGVRVLSNLAEISAEHRALLRVLAYRLQQAKRTDLALPLLARVCELAPNEPQSWRDWGLALAEMGQTQTAVDALWRVVSQPWDSRFRDVDQTALAELNAIIHAAPKEAALDVSKIDPRLRKHLPLGLRIVLRWDADNTDIDLHVLEPSGEEAMFSSPRTLQGGKVSADVTGGYGPEEYALRKPQPGTYTVRANFYGHRQQTVSNATTVQAEVTTDFGTPAQQTRTLTLRLSGRASLVEIGRVTVAP